MTPAQTGTTPNGEPSPKKGNESDMDEEDAQHEQFKVYFSCKEKVVVMHANINGYKTNGVPLEAALTLLEINGTKPVILLLNETKTEEGDALTVSGYTIVCRKDRNMHGGGVAVFCRNDQVPRTTLVEASKAHERCWICFHTDEGPVLVCAWYRPPDTSLPRETHLDGHTSFMEELTRLSINARGVLVMGDLMGLSSWQFMAKSDGNYHHENSFDGILAR